MNKMKRVPRCLEEMRFLPPKSTSHTTSVMVQYLSRNITTISQSTTNNISIKKKRDRYTQSQQQNAKNLKQ